MIVQTELTAAQKAVKSFHSMPSPHTPPQVKLECICFGAVLHSSGFIPLTAVKDTTAEYIFNKLQQVNVRHRKDQKMVKKGQQYIRLKFSVARAECPASVQMIQYMLQDASVINIITAFLKIYFIIIVIFCAGENYCSAYSAIKKKIKSHFSAFSFQFLG